MIKVYLEVINQVKRCGELNKSEGESLNNGSMHMCKSADSTLALCDLLAGKSTEGNVHQIIMCMYHHCAAPPISVEETNLRKLLR